MKQTYLLPAAMDVATRQTVKTQDLKGVRYTSSQRALAQAEADRVAVRMSNGTDATWVGKLIEYTLDDVGVRRF